MACIILYCLPAVNKLANNFCKQRAEGFHISLVIAPTCTYIHIISEMGTTSFTHSHIPSEYKRLSLIPRSHPAFRHFSMEILKATESWTGLQETTNKLCVGRVLGTRPVITSSLGLPPLEGGGLGKRLGQWRIVRHSLIPRLPPFLPCAPNNKNLGSFEVSFWHGLHYFVLDSWLHH